MPSYLDEIPLTITRAVAGGQRSVSDVPTIYHRLRFLMVGTLRFVHPTDRELICFAHKRNLDTQLRPIGTTGKSAKAVQPL